jgi:membrane protease YdiL (CAAX protease family)
MTFIAVAEPLRTTLGALPIVPLLLPVVASTLIVRPIPWARMSERLLPRGRLDGTSLVLLTITALVSAGALVAWATWTNNLGAGLRMMESAARLPRVLLVAVGIPAFAVLNAITEEVAYRGVLQRGLTATVSSVPLILVSQALAFAALHFQSGFPNGVVGYLMVAVYGVALGYLRHRTGGLAAPLLAHVLADLVIAYVLLAQVGAASNAVPIVGPA